MMDLFESLYRENKKLSRINEDIEINPDWKDELRHRLIMINDDGYLCDSSIVDCCKDLHYDYPDVDFDEAYDYAYSLVDSDDLYEDTVKQANGKWVNKGKEGTHGEFKTKKAADAQRKSMFANGYKGESKVYDALSNDSELNNTKVPNVSPIVSKVLERFDYATLDLNHPDTIMIDVSDIIKKAETVVNALGREGVKAEVIYTGSDGTDICIKILHTPDEDQQIIFK